MKNILAIVNPNSGNSNNEDYIDILNKKLKTYFDQVIIDVTKDEEDVVRLTEKACQENFHSICAFGGDGTINQILNVLMDEEEPPKLAILPGGTGNILAQTLQIPVNRRMAIHRMDFSKTIPMDLGVVEDHCFSFFLSIGPIPETIHDADPKDKKQFGIFAYIFKSVQALRDSVDPYFLKVKTECGEFEGYVDHLVVSLTNKYGKLKFSDVKSSLSDGYAHVYILKDASLNKKATTVFNILGGNVEENENIVHFQAKNIVIEGQEDIETDVDGNKGPHLPVKIEILKEKVEIYV